RPRAGGGRRGGPAPRASASSSRGRGSRARAGAAPPPPRPVLPAPRAPPRRHRPPRRARAPTAGARAPSRAPARSAGSRHGVDLLWHPVGEREVERAAAADLRLDPDLPAVLLDGELAERQPHARVVAVVDGVARLLEGVEDALLVGLGDALAVVAHAEHEVPVLPPGPEVDVAAPAGVLDRVGH